MGVVLKSELGALHPLLGMRLLTGQGALSDAGRARSRPGAETVRVFPVRAATSAFPCARAV